MSAGSTIYRGMTRAELDAAYNNRAAVPSFERTSREWAARSRAVHARGRSLRGLQYGSGPRQLVDLILPEPGTARAAPVLAFIHGGYWQGGSIESCAFLAEQWPRDGVAVCLIEYTVAPEGRIGAMTQEISMALDWLGTHCADHGLDAKRVCLAGHSAGGHLTAMAIGHPVVGAAIAISGLFDLEPIRLCYLNDKLGLLPGDVERYSPIRRPLDASKPFVVGVGGAELPELRRQSRDYAAALGSAARYVELAGCDHFSVLEELARPDGTLYRIAGELMNLQPAPTKEQGDE